MNKKALITTLLLLLCGAMMGGSVIGNLTESAKLGFQFTTDLTLFTYPGASEDYVAGDLDPDLPNYEDLLKAMGTSEFLAYQMGTKDMFWARCDLSFDANLSNNTYVSALLAFRMMGLDSGSPDDFSYTFLKSEINHKFMDKYHLRVGRLNEKYSKSRFFGRIDLGSGDSHIFGRTPYVNDAVELSLPSANWDLPVGFAIGVKPEFKPFQYAKAYVNTNFTQPIGDNKLNGFVTYALNRQDSLEVLSMFPHIDSTRYYHSVEGELSFDISNKSTIFANAGFLANYIGKAPHFSGPTDITKNNEPMIIDADESIAQTMTAAFGIKTRPGNFIKPLSFLKEVTVEAEMPGLGNDAYDAFNTYCHVRCDYKKLQFHYGFYMNNISYEDPYRFRNSSGKVVLLTDELHNYVHFIRLTTTF